MKPRLAYGLALMLVLLSINWKIPRTLAAGSSSDTDDYHYDDEDDDYDYDYSDKDSSAKGVGTAGADSDKLLPSTTTTSTTTSSTTMPPPVANKTTAAPLWSDEDDVREVYPCPQQCSCEDGTQFLNCSHQSLTEVPEDLPRDVIRLDLSWNNIKHIPVEAFQNCTDLRELLLDRNVIEEVDKEVFVGLIRLDMVGLEGNQISHLTPDTFTEAQSLRRLVLNENPLVIPDDGPLLLQEELEELELAKCNFTELNHQTFGGLENLKSLNLAGNVFDEDLSTDVFEPLVNLQRLHLPPLSEDTVRDLCDVIKSIDVVDITTHNISCFYLASETSYEESIITLRPTTPEPRQEPTKDPDVMDATTAKPLKRKVIKENEIEVDGEEATKSTVAPVTRVTSRRTTIGPTTTIVTTKAPPTVSGPSSASITHPAENDDDVKKDPTSEGDKQSVLSSISSDMMKQLLMGIIGVGVLLLIAGIVCRRTGLKNKLCGSKRRPAPTDQVRPAEEVPLNKV
ncbi:probable serine/threonine-protein kinase roco5 [Wyeomyia smithii]|uniref:probable serine/threonine-protein kinase roco5 n=1 Tax=Wyeomyia smithii TaxID=174621 RepID=UPI002467CE75|nr:probable serine/threonine-protein kinase roco5 [Wyeomyia smithii]XP_055534734.1 probable serine/threonine-protein kinase roco5 [Wyeomyia smithii]